MTLERRDNNKGYSPDNCEWATRTTQQRNRGTVRQVTFNGVTQTIAAWAEQTGMTHATISARLNAGWTPERTLTIRPVRGGRVVEVEYEGRTQSVTDWAREYGLSPETLRHRLMKGWDMKKALTVVPVPGGTNAHA